jgi:hypothetical protein
MPTHNIVTPNLQLDGPIIEITAGVSAVLESILVSRGLSIPTPIRGTGIIDTGASHSAIQVSVIASLGIPPVGNTPVASAGGRLRYDKYNLRLSFPALASSPRELPVLGVNLGNSRIIALIGRDIMKDWIVHYDGPAGTCSVAY